ncbi:ThuA domain-containing protein [Candidatus Solirubrobacter pratensis]|uniref:ThuA domain-containing protein n=1 Tax=Candidatus Solirubrobacter pratensis TaxID=1298857 RepID=UPI0009DBF8D0|nr:ThuA domain-containing protein [Candidatus Solirubrobacter pratensis]
MGRTKAAIAACFAVLFGLVLGGGTAFAQTPTASDFQKVTLDDNTQNPMELDVAPDGRVFYIERDGRLQVWKPDTQQTVTAGTIPVTRSQENGLLGLQLAPDFAFSKWVYLFYSQLPDNTLTQVVSRFKMNGDTLDLSSEQKILTFQHQTAECCHSSGSLYFGPDGSLYISTGDNTNPFDSDGFAPLDERPGREYWDSQRTAGNTNDLNGKILRIKPMEIPLGPPGVGTTYTIPAGNLFPEDQDTDNKTRPEIYGMGFRNPFRFTVDQTTGWVLSADYGPDAGTTNPNRGPQGSVEYNVLTKSGNYGWPYCIRANTPYNDYDFATGVSGPKFNCDAPVNNSPNNTGRTNLPPAIPATAWMGYTEQDPRFTPDLGTGGAPMGGPRYHFDPSLSSDRKFPQYYDNKWFIGEWNNGWIKTADLDASGAMTKVSPFALGTGYKRPMDIDFGPDGALYVIEWGSGFGGDNADSGVYRIDYVSGNKSPVAKATGDTTTGLAPLTVHFSSAGSSDPEGTALTYSWDFNGDGTQDSAEAAPTYTYTQNGAYTAKLTVKDADGMTAVANVPITVGNRGPVVTIQTPADGEFASFTDTVPYSITVTDPEDGTTGAGISCDDVHVTIALGHDEHAHDLSQQTGCTGTFKTGLTSGHGPEANTFTVLSVTYTDKGGPGGIVPITGRAQAILQPKTKQAEFYASTGRIPGAATTGDPGVQKETTSDSAGGGQNIGFIEDGDYVSYTPVSLQDINAVRFRVASAGSGGTIELHLDSGTGPLVGATANITPTGGWQTFKDVTLQLTNPPTGTHELFVVFRKPGDTGSLMNLNWIEFIGKGAAVTASPDVQVTPTPATGAAPLNVKFETTATDPDGPATDLTYAWDFGVPGITTDTSTLEDPTYTYVNPGTYNATLTVTDKQGGKTDRTIPVVVTPGASCASTFRDDFNGTDLDAGWSVVRRSQNLVVSGGTANITTENGDVYTNSNNAKNIVLRQAPTGPWTATVKVNEAGTRQYHQAGLIVYGDDDNYTKFDRLATSTADPPQEHFEFINEVAGVARNAAADSGPTLTAAFPTDWYMKIESDGTNIRGYYSPDGTNWTLTGQPAALPANARVGFFGLDNAAATHVTAKFDWFTLASAGSGGSSGAGDDFTGTSLDKTRWNGIVREDPTLYSVANGSLKMTTVKADVDGGNKNFILQTADHTGADYVLETKLSAWTLQGSFQQGGILIWADDQNYVKFNAISDSTNTRINRSEIRAKVAGTIINPQPNLDVPAGVTAIWMRLTKSGTNYLAEMSFDGTTWQTVGTVPFASAAPRFGLYTAGVDGSGQTATFDYFKVNGSLGCDGGGNTSPVITTASATPTAGFAPLATSFTAAATDAQNDPLTYSWDFDGDGTADATGANASTTFTTAGDRSVKLTVTDGKGGSATKTIPVQVLAADDPNARFRALVFSKTAGFRHDSIPQGIAAIKQLGQQKNFQVDATEDASLFTDAVLSHYDTVIWLSTTGDVLNDAQQAAFERFIRAGGGYTGIHAAADTEYSWPWYGKLVGSYFRNHPSGTPTADVLVEDANDPSDAGLPARWTRTDEWYNYKSPLFATVGDADYSPRNTTGVHVLLKMDEATYDEQDDNTTDDDHPISWCQKYDGGRSWYTGMGHTQQSFSEAGFLTHIEAGIEIAAGATPSAACGVTGANQPPTVTASRTPAGDITVGDTVAFTATGTDADGDTLTYAWDFADGGTSTQQNPSHQFATSGTRAVKVTVSDGKGGTASATLSVVVKQPGGGDHVDQPVTIGGTVPGVLALSLGTTPGFGTFVPNVAKDYTAALTATVTTSASAATLTVRDPSATATGRLVNGASALAQPVQVKAGSTVGTGGGAFAPLSTSGAPLTLLSYPAAVSGDPVSIDLKQTIGAGEPLLTGNYAKTIVFTLASTTP